MALPTALPTPYAAFLPSYSFNPAVLSFASNLPTSYAPAALKAWYLTANPLHPALLFSGVMSFLVWIVGEITGNVSQVDRLWTFLPMIYSIHFTMWPKWTGTGELDQRMLLVLGLQTLWSLRLTTNTYRRGFFNPSSEDYRWDIVRARIPVWQFKLMNFFFIAIIQNLLLAAAELPQYLLLTLTPAYSPAYRVPAVGMADYVLSAIFVGILCIEMLADNQQQRFQAFKAKATKSGKTLTVQEQGRLNRGFVTEGLWAWSRHPNFACEQSTWYILYAFTIVPFLPASLSISTLANTVATTDVVGLGKSLQGLLWNYAMWSPITMSMLFYSSTHLTEEISSAKYPLYAQYKRAVGEFWPPITVLKSVWLMLTGRRSEVKEKVWGGAVGEKKRQ